jgi:FtsH-binding integral membrane protein
VSTTERVQDDERYNFTGSAAFAVLAGAALAWSARSGAVQLLVAVAAAQALLAVTWIYVLRVPGRIGGLVIAGLAAGACDVAASVWPHSRLAVLLVVVGLAVPVMFVHQLSRGAARVRVGRSLGAVALIVVAEAAMAALLQVRHEFPTGGLGGDATLAVVVAVAGALIAGYCTDMVVAAPRFDADVPRGLPAVGVSALVGAALGHLVLRGAPDFSGGRGAFVGAAVGVLAALLAVGMAYVEAVAPLASGGFARRSRPLLSVLMPLALVAPVGFLLCTAIST